MLEGSVVTWTRQIKNVLKTDPENLLKAQEHPGPLAQIKFWEAKAANLNSIHDQLTGAKIKKIIKVLELAKSTYCPTFGRLCSEVAQARLEANENVAYLNTMGGLFDQLSVSDDFVALREIFRSMMHGILLIWKNSVHFNTPARLVVLFRMISNDLIRQAAKFCDGLTIFEVEPQDAVDRVKQAIELCMKFQKDYMEYKNKANIECKQNPWRVQMPALFGRLDTFLERCSDMQDLVETILQFNRLDKVEIGGTKGKTLTDSVLQVFNDFLVSVKKFEEVTYDVFDVEEKQFEEDYYHFRVQIKEMERRLGSVLVQGLDDCATVDAAFKLLGSFEGLLEREIIQNELERRYIGLLNQYSADLKQVQEMFLLKKTSPPIYNNMPPIAGSLNWSRGLGDRADQPMAKFRQCSKSILDSDEMKEVEKMHAGIMENLQEYERMKCEDWEKEIDVSVAAKLKQPLLRRDIESKALHVNFDKALVRLLREVKYFLILKLDVPDTAMAIYKRAEHFRTQTGNLDLIVNKYNWVLENLLEVERPLVQQQLTDIDTYVEKGIKQLNWKSHGINDFIGHSMSQVQETETILKTLKDNVSKVQAILEKWSSNPLMERKDQRIYHVDELQSQHEEVVSDRCDKIVEAGEAIHEIVALSNKVVKVSKGAQSWRAYVEYINNIVIDGFALTTVNSLKFLRNQVDPVFIKRGDIQPLVEVKLELELPEILFDPCLDGSSGRQSLRDAVYGFMRDFYSVGCQMKRLDTKDGDYIKELEESLTVRKFVDEILMHLSYNEEQCHKFREAFSAFEYLWTKDLDEAFKEFWEAESVDAVAPAAGPEGADGEGAAGEAPAVPEQVDDDDEEGAKKRGKPPLEAFELKILHYRAVQDEVNHLVSHQDIGWLRVDSKPVKNQLVYWAGQWVALYTEFLLNEVIDSMTEMVDFIQHSNQLLDQEVSDDDQDKLQEILACIRDVKKLTPKYDDMIEPLRDQTTLLKKFGLSAPDEILQSMDEAPMQWDSVKRKMFDTKERLNDLYNKEGDKIKQRSIDFGKRLQEFRSIFPKEAPFKWSVGLDNAYVGLDDFRTQLSAFEKETQELRETQELFELVPMDSREVRDCSKELNLLKQVWDTAALVQNMFGDWKTTLWEMIDTDMLTDETKKVKDIVKRLDKKTRSWDAFKGLEGEVQNMLTALPLIQQLKSPSMRGRHWKELMLVTGTHFTMDSNFCLADLLSLQLHQYAEDVENVVIKSQKELVIERNLAKISEIWDKMELQYRPYPKDEGVKLVSVGEELVEAREENQVNLQAMQSSKYIKNFEEQVNSWLRKLGLVEAVTAVWGVVQEKWMQLESIFIGSEDIRAQLPEDSKRFDTIDQDWRELMAEIQFVPLALDACTREGVLDKLESMQDKLELCQKALNDYLETKCSTFPRFYFVAAADLLDILSKGSNPMEIQTHYGKCFDNVGSLEFDVEEAKTGKSTTVIGMFSGEKEHVPFPEIFKAEGPVEVYLQALVDHHHEALRVILQESLGTYDPQKRDEWLFGYCVQVMLVASMIWWTSEVVAAFNLFEEGMDTALKDQWTRQVDQLTQLTVQVRRTDLTKNDRRKLVNQITNDVHQRDIVDRLIQKRVENSTCFEWMRQLRLFWDDEAATCMFDIADGKFHYGYEYIGNTFRLVITPLTDRCYITLTQAMKLKMGGAPAGPAGTGKTETVKDLARATGILCYVFNCSEQMNSAYMASTFKGLSSTGAWGCFDEFNRIPIEVLSVVATQYRAVLMAIRNLAKQPYPHHSIGQFDFEGEPCDCVATNCAFITMNPGYAGRTELPENVKALFRYVAMIVPDLEMICEIFLFSEGFQQAKDLARKFHLLYRLNKDLLSVQTHYDWGLRAIKSVLMIAGGLKRQDPDLDEEGVLMRALRDCNLPKLVSDDAEIFMGLISDLFPGWSEKLPRKRDVEFEGVVKTVCTEMQLQPEENFVMKVTALVELFAVRHSVFVIGLPGAGKSTVWKVLAASSSKVGDKVYHEVINPKAQTSNELYGFMHPTVGWKDGIFSNVMRNFYQMTNQNAKWIVLDGDVDPEWIESLNTVMDDNKTLTLASNERIPLDPTMRILVEVADLRNATPATVSRGGVLYINERDIGWKPYADSWIDKRDHAGLRNILTMFVSTYVETTLDYMKRNIKAIAPVQEMNMICTLCWLLEGLLTEEVQELAKEQLEVYFVFAAVWGFGSALSIDKGVDYRKQFSDWWKLSWTEVKFGDNLVYDYMVDSSSHSFVSWDGIVPVYSHVQDSAFSSIMVSNMDTTRLTYLMNMLAENQHALMFVGLAGTGKTTVVREKLKNLEDDWSCNTISLNSRTDAFALQLMMEMLLEKRAGKTYTPLGNKKHIYFIDDLNMPGLDKYGTQTPIELLVQLVDHGFLYDRVKCGLQKEIKNIQFIGAMNPTAGSFVINGRLQRQMSCFAINLPSSDMVETIFLSILRGHLSVFDTSVQNIADKIISATVYLHNTMLKDFLPSAIKFHYQWNLRELSNICQGVMEARPEYYGYPTALARLWVHEVNRVYGDRLMTEKDTEVFREKTREAAAKCLEDVDIEKVLEEPIVFASFCGQNPDDKIYLPVVDYAKLGKVLDEKLIEHNENEVNMDLVLFESFMDHVSRICRIIDKGRGNAMLVGVGGSGKQSITKLSAFISGQRVFRIQLTGNYSVNDLKVDMMGMYKLAGVKDEPVCWILTDSQIVNEDFLVYINDFLSSGNIPDLFCREDKDDVINAVRNEVKAEGTIDTNDNCWEFFIEKVRRNMHLVFCMSPVGDHFRNWCRKFPALINCSVIDWVHSWPEEALKSVAQRFLSTVDLTACGETAEQVQANICAHVSNVHLQTVETCIRYQNAERRYNYATPKSFLELIDFYKNLLGKKREALMEEFETLQVGLQKLEETEEDVKGLKLRLEEESEFVATKTIAVNALIENVGAETVIVDAAKAEADAESAKANIEAEAAGKVQVECDSELAKAEPLVTSALAALDTLSKESIGELKNYSNPPAGVDDVLSAVMYMISPPGKLCKDVSFKAGKKEIGNPADFVARLKGMDLDNIPRANINAVVKILTAKEIDPVEIQGKSQAAGGMANWVVNIVQYDQVYQMITPLRNSLAEAKAKLFAAEKCVATAQGKVDELEKKMKVLTDEFEGATNEANELKENAAKTEKKLTLAERLVNGLSDEKVRWAQNIENMKVANLRLIGDCLVCASFVSYIGAFSAEFRKELIESIWLPDLKAKEIPSSDVINPLTLLTDPATMATWGNEGLPTDQLSIENAVIITSCSRWPLIVDPQLQGVTWIKSREAENEMRTITLSGRFLDVVERCISMGDPLLIENIGEHIDAVLDPVLARAVVKRGTQMFIKLGDNDDVEYDSRFRMYLQSKMPNPHYKPEICAQTTLINFTVTESGLEDQLLAVVVGHERPDLEETRAELIRQQNEFTKTLKELEVGLLYKLSHAEGNLVEDIDLIEGLENTKVTANEIEVKKKEAAITTQDINKSRESYRSIATRASLIYFVLNQLWIIDHMYQYSLGGFMRVFRKAISKAESAEDLAVRVNHIVDCVTYTMFGYASRGLFARHKLVFASQLCFRIMDKAGELNLEHFNFLLRSPKDTKNEKPFELEWLPDGSWYTVQALKDIDGFNKLGDDLVSSSKRFKEWCDLEASEKEKLPLEYKSLPPLQRLLVIRCLRPDRMTMAMEMFVGEYMGAKYVGDVDASLINCLPETDPATPVYYILSPGVDVVGEVERQAAERDFLASNQKFADVSLGEGKDIISDKEVDRLTKDGGWVILQNIHLMPRWLIELEKRIESKAPEAHPDFRLFLTSDPSNSIPVALLQRSIKLTQEPPPGLKALFKRSWGLFNDLTWENSSKAIEFKQTLFALAFFHGVMCERKKFGPQGWNRVYPFGGGDLTVCKDVLNNYLESSGTTIPWDDLKYIFGEIMYGGHITDDFDRRLCATYLDKYMVNELFENLELFPGFGVAPNSSHAKMHEYLEESFPTETPVMFGLHPNAEIGFRTEQSDGLFNVLADLQPRQASGGGGATVQERVQVVMEDIQDKFADSLFDIEDLAGRIDAEGGRTPFVNVFFQECKYMNTLITEIKKGLEVLGLGLSGDLQMSDEMEQTMNCLYDNNVPPTWEKKAYPSQRPLAGWVDNLRDRVKQLADWSGELMLPKAVWICGFFNPQSFLTAVMQSQARKNEWALDRVVVMTEVTKKSPEEVEGPSRDGSFIHGLIMEGSRWDSGLNSIDESKMKEMFCQMPVMLVRAVQVDKAEYKDNYMCPCYKTQARNGIMGGFVFTANLKTKKEASKWVMAGVALLMDVVV